MSSTPQPVRGTQSLLGEEADRLHAVAEAFDRVRRLFGFKRVEVPIIESTAVFARSLGETTDVVSKEMYTFEDRSRDSITLRPELTAVIARAYLTEKWQHYSPLKVATHGPAFRYERPQKGRFRQFHQLDAEIIGAAEPQADVEILSFGSQLLRELGIADFATLQLNTLGDPETREAWRSALIMYFSDFRSELSEDCQKRLDKNPLRILDSKDPQDRSVTANAPRIDDYLSSQAADFFAEVTSGLDAAGVRWTRNPSLVRGLDYYRHTVFEFVTDRLGAQGALIAGGRYDGLVEALGGPHTPAIGWAAGVERLAELIAPPIDRAEKVGIVPEGDESTALAMEIASILRSKGIATDTLYGGSSRKQLDKLRRRGITVALFVKRQPGTYAALNVKVFRRMAHDTVWRIAKAFADRFEIRIDTLVKEELHSLEDVSDIVIESPEPE